MDMEFEKVRDEFDSIELNRTAAREHFGEIECEVCIFKERCMCVLSDLCLAGVKYFNK